MTVPIKAIGVKPLTKIFEEEGERSRRNVTIQELAVAHPFYAKYAASGFTHVHIFREASRLDIEIDYALFCLDAAYFAGEHQCVCVFSDLAAMPSGRMAVFLYFLKAQPSATPE